MAKSWTIAEIPPQTGLRYFITGANSGIGFWTAVELARRGAAVILACRDAARGQAALARLRQLAPQAEAELVSLNLASLASVQEAAAAELAKNRPLHGLINNAGVFAPPQRRTTEDGFELQFGTNVLGHFALTCRLLPALELGRAAQVVDAPRVVTLASIAHKRGQIAFDDLQSERSYNGQKAYYQSKLGDLMFAFELERRLRAAKSGVLSIAAHPGVAQTNLFKVGNSQGISAGIEKLIQWTVAKTLNDEHEGAVPTLFAATSPDAEPGGYYGPQGFQEMRGGDVGPAQVAPQALDEQAQARLWKVCEQLTGVTL
jgi:NAD(P)-dependent dehydrogenase (short-subunit alcohol dehydrogenase family)